MQNTWLFHDAEKRLSEVIDNAIERGPQILIRQGEKVAVVLSYAEFSNLAKPSIPLSEFFQKSPLGEITFERDRSDLR